MQELQEKKKKPYNSVTYTTGDPQVNCDHFNKMLAGKEINTHTDGILNGTFKHDNSSAEKACAEVGTFASASPDGASSVSLGGGESTGGEASGAVGESLDLTEAGGKKGRKVTRYFIKPHNIWCAKKTDILNALIDHADENCTVYTLIHLDDNKDVTKLTNNDVIYYYEDGILYDKNHVRVMDYDLAVKHEEERAKLDVEHASDAQIEKVYNDRITGEMSESLNELDLEFEDFNVFGEKLLEGKEVEEKCCICGEPIEGYGNNAEPYAHGKCCDACNIKFVIPERLEKLGEKE